MSDAERVQAWYSFYVAALEAECDADAGRDLSRYDPISFELFEARWQRLQGDPLGLTHQMLCFERASAKFGIPMVT